MNFKWNKDTYIKRVKSLYIFNVIYTLLNTLVLPLLLITLAIKNGSNNILIYTYVGLLLFTIFLYYLTIKVSKYKYNYVDTALHNFVYVKIRMCFGFIAISLFPILFILAADLFIVLNVIDYPLWLFYTILFSTFIGYCVLMYYYVKKSFFS